MPNPEYFPIPNWTPLFEAPKHLFVGARSVYLLCRASKATTELLPFPLEPVLGQEDLYRFTFTKVDKIYTPTIVARDILMLEIGFPTAYRGEVAAHNSLEYIDSDFGMSVGREDYGWPKKMARLSWSELEDGRIHAEAQRDGHTLLMLDFEQTDREFRYPEWFDGDYLQVRSLDRANEGAAKRMEVIRSNIPGWVSHSTFAGTASLRLFDGPTDPLSFLDPIEVLAARIDTYDFEFDWGVVVDTVDVPDPDQYLAAQARLAHRLRTEAGFPPVAYDLTAHDGLSSTSSRRLDERGKA